MDNHKTAPQLVKLVQPISTCKIVHSTIHRTSHSVLSVSPTTICSKILALCAVKAKGSPNREGVPSVRPTAVIAVSKASRKYLIRLGKGLVQLARSPHSTHSMNWNRIGVSSVLLPTQANANIVRLGSSGVSPIRSVVN